jgi:hypothetical protein
MYSEFERRINKLSQEGMIDFKITVFPDKDTCVTSTILTVNNILRLREEGKLIKGDIR